MAKTVAQKARVKPGTTIAVLHPVPGIVESLGLPEGVTFTGTEDAQLVFVFVSSRSELDSRMPAAAAVLPAGAAMWVFFRKGSRAAGREVNRDDVWAVAERLGLRPLGLVGVDGEWSAFRLRRAR